MAFGEVGILRRGGFADGEVVRIDFTDPLSTPIIHLSSTNNGGNEFSLRVINVDANGFDFMLEEWEDEDGPHGANETITWIAVEPGVHVLPDGRIVEAGTTTASTTASSVTLNGGFTATPAVLTNVMSDNEVDVVDSDPFNVTSSGFDVQLQEGSIVDGVNNGEAVGYIAIETGGDGSWGYTSIQSSVASPNRTFNIGGALTDGAVFAETQTINETDAGNVAFRNDANIRGGSGTSQMRFDEESSDGETTHGNEDVGIVAFEQGRLMCLTDESLVKTPSGARKAGALQVGDYVNTKDHRAQPIRQVLSRKLSREELDLNPKLAPIRICAGALGDNVPNRDLSVSPQHRMLVSSAVATRMFGQSDVLVAATRLTALSGVFIDKEVNSVRYVHLLFDRHEIIWAEGAATESLLLSPQTLADLPEETRAEIATLFPDLPKFAEPKTACLIPSNTRQNRLVSRHVKNALPIYTGASA